MNDSLFSSKTVEWSTPQDFFDKLNEEFHFTLDPCSTDENAKCKKHYTKEQDGLAQDWTGETVYCNPPYGREMPKWIQKCYEHFVTGGGHSGYVNPRSDGHESVPRLYLRQSGNQIRAWTAEIRKRQGPRSVPVNGGYL